MVCSGFKTSFIRVEMLAEVQCVTSRTTRTEVLAHVESKGWLGQQRGLDGYGPFHWTIRRSVPYADPSARVSHLVEGLEGDVLLAVQLELPPLRVPLGPGAARALPRRLHLPHACYARRARVLTGPGASYYL